MYNFAYGMHAYLTTIQSLTQNELVAVGLTEKERDTLLTQAYPLQRINQDTGNAAAFSFEEQTFKDGTYNLSFAYKHTPQIDNYSFHEAVCVAAHEANHSLRWEMTNQSSNEFYKKPGYAVFSASVIFSMFSDMDFDYMNLGTMSLIGAGLGYATYASIRNSIKYHDEKKAYRHDGAIQSILNPRARTLQQNQKEKDDLSKKMTFLGAAKDILVSGYPSPDRQRMLSLQGEEMALYHGLKYDKDRADFIVNETQKNIRTHQFKIFDLR